MRSLRWSLFERKFFNYDQRHHVLLRRRAFSKLYTIHSRISTKMRARARTCSQLIFIISQITSRDFLKATLSNVLKARPHIAWFYSHTPPFLLTVLCDLESFTPNHTFSFSHFLSAATEDYFVSLHSTSFSNSSVIWHALINSDDFNYLAANPVCQLNTCAISLFVLSFILFFLFFFSSRQK